MEEEVIRPTAKFIKAGAIVSAVAILALEILYLNHRNAGPAWMMIVPPLILLWPASRWLRRRFTTVTIVNGRLRYETGIAGRSTRTIQLAKIQDVRVDQRIAQRMFDVGDLSIETAGEASRLTLHNIDRPQSLADKLMDLAQQGSPHL